MAMKPPKRSECEAAVNAVASTRTKSAAARLLNIPRATLVGRLECAKRYYDLEIPDSMRTPPNEGMAEIEITDGVVMVGSDAHYWPGEPSTAHRAFVKLAERFSKEKVLRAVIKNGDALDFPRTSRHPPLGWTRMPETRDEIEVCQERLGEICKAAGKVHRFWPLGNHDARFETYLAGHAPEIAGVRGTRLVDHFPDWTPCWSVFVNNRPGGLVVKHRFKGGVHAPHNNALWSGRTMVTGHLHSQKCQPISDYNGVRWGVDTGCMADPWGPQFQYLETNPRNWVSGFAVFTFAKGELLPPELVTCLSEDRVVFRGEVMEV